MNHRKMVSMLCFICAVMSLAAIEPWGSACAAEATEAGQNIVSGVMSGSNKAIMAMAAMGAVGISCISSGYALARIGSAAMGAMSEKPEIGGRALVFLGMAEGIAIYGLIIAIMMLNKI